jgi:hypothetical protein
MVRMMSANEVLEQVKALPPRERRKFFECVHELETAGGIKRSARSKRQVSSPGVSTHNATVKTGETVALTASAIRHHPYDPYNPKVRERRMKLIQGLNVRHNPKIADAEAALEKVIDEMYPETKHAD